MPKPCVFCEVVAGGEDLVVDEPDVAAFLDIRPLFPGHLLIVPRQHIVTLDELPTDQLVPLFSVAQRAVTAMQTAMGAEGAFVAQNNIVSQSVPHLHVHVVPRTTGDGLKGFFWPRRGYRDDDHKAEVLAALRTSLA